MSGKLRNMAAAAEERITGKRFCTAHQGATEIPGGMMRASKGSPRWICASCAAKSKFKARPMTDEETMRDLAVPKITVPREYSPFAQKPWTPPKLLIRDGAEEYKTWPSKGGD